MIINFLKPITIVGIMGCGKTQFAKKLSKKLNLPSIDLDNFMEKKFNKSIKDLYFECENTFKMKELESLKILFIKKHKNLIISTGDSIINNEEGFNFIINNSFCIWLNPCLKQTFSRLKPNKNRPLLKEDINFEEFNQIYQERKNKYNKSHIEIKKI